jgi:tRNA-dihydrouridine synthase 3
MRRHRSEDVFGVQICAAYPDTAARAAEIIDKESEVDFIDINVGCPIDLVVNKGAGSCLLTKPSRLQQIVKATANSIECQLTVKVSSCFFCDII